MKMNVKRGNTKIGT